MLLRAFEPRDYPRQAAIGAAIEPGLARGVAWYRGRDQHRDPTLYHKRLVAELDNLVVGWGEVGHMWWAYHPRKFVLRLNVDPLYQRQGVGSRLYTRLTDTLTRFDPVVLRAETRENRPDSVSFLANRGFVEVRRRFESCLLLDRARVERYAAAGERLRQQAIDIVTFADERARRGEHAVRDLYELEQRANSDEPGFDAESASIPFARFVAHELDPAELLEDGTFLARSEQRLVGVSRLLRDPAVPGRLHVGFTGVDPAFRGRGIAVALKLRTVDYGRAHGFDEIRTQNDTANASMLHINAALGFQQEPAWLVFHKPFPTPAVPTA